jgi:hypothetical protein
VKNGVWLLHDDGEPVAGFYSRENADAAAECLRAMHRAYGHTPRVRVCRLPVYTRVQWYLKDAGIRSLT